MGTRISPRVPLLLKPQPFPDEIPPIPVVLPIAVEVPEKFPVKLKTGSELDVKVRPKGESTEVMEESNRAVQMANGYKAGGGKMKSVIPKKRKSVKTMMYHSISNFVISLFRSPPSTTIAGTGAAP